MRTATGGLIGEGARPPVWDLPLKLWRMGFSGWSPKAVEFFQDLQADNTKAFWSAHKDFYEASVREPMAELLDELSGEFGPGRIARPTGMYGSAPTSRRTRPRSTRPWTGAGM